MRNYDKFLLEEKKKEKAYMKKFFPVSHDLLERKIRSNREIPINGEDAYHPRLGEAKKAILSRLNMNKSDIYFKLTHLQMLCLYLYFWRGMTEAEIADTTKRHQVTVSHHIRSAVKKLRKELMPLVGANNT